jgi:hypothetical protein
MDGFHRKTNRTRLTGLGRQNKWNKVGSVDRSGRNVRIDGDPVFATTVDNLEEPVIAPGPLKHLRVQVFVPVIALEGSEHPRPKEEPGSDPCRSREKQGNYGWEPLRRARWTGDPENFVLRQLAYEGCHYTIDVLSIRFREVR